ncbi:uncharacterized protein LOC135075396 [Ostrinia nubilalis]|uniref:uncharacterized protein LOC135075396 n=1 Tax=Ostrinia nubilalis TaxID=29057 RepID=UPI0030822CFB
MGTADSSQMQMNPVSKIQCAKKEKDTSPPPHNSPRHEARDATPRYDVRDATPRYDVRDNTPRYDRDNSPRHEQKDIRDSIDSPRFEVHDSPRRESPRPSPRPDGSERDRTNKMLSGAPGGRCEVTRIVRQLCGGDAAGGRNERVTGAKNAQLLCVNGSSPRQPSTPQLLRILEETIQKKVPKTFFPKSSPSKNAERFRLTFNIPERTAERVFQYRTKFVQHMLASPMYANCAVGKPWEMVGRTRNGSNIPEQYRSKFVQHTLASPMYANCAVGKPWEMVGSVSEQLIDELLSGVAHELQLRGAVRALYDAETH